MMRSSKKNVERLLAFPVTANLILFLTLACLGKVSNDPNTLVFLDFWGRLTVYSLWFMACELYREHISDPVTKLA